MNRPVAVTSSPMIGARPRSTNRFLSPIGALESPLQSCEIVASHSPRGRSEHFQEVLDRIRFAGKTDVVSIWFVRRRKHFAIGIQNREPRVTPARLSAKRLHDLGGVRPARVHLDP